MQRKLDAAEGALLLFQNSKQSSVSHLSDWTISSAKKRRKTIDKRCAPMDVADPASLVLLAKRLHHQELMELHDHFKKKQKDAKHVVSAKNTTTTHGLAPWGMSIPEKGNAYVIGVITLLKSHYVQSIQRGRGES
jgi:hypothetical protein